ncbi:MAG: TerB family tellurite resistance protein [Bryobacterales bacterium]|nr:TerB family tellurite resistance protein [Bryobacterales bacterium]
MGLFDFLGLGGGAPAPKDASSAETIRKISSSLEQMDKEQARYIACFAYLLGRVALADLEISDEETREMEHIVAARADLSEEQAALVVQIAKTQNQLFGGTENYVIASEFNRIATRAQKVALLHCLFAVSSSDRSISTVEDNEIRIISQELRLDHADFIAARSAFREHLEVLKRPEESAPEEEPSE